MPAYFIFHHKVTDSTRLNDEYLPKAIETLEQFSPETLVVDQDPEVVEGTPPGDRMVVLRFESKEEAKAWYSSPEYQAIINLRLSAVDGHAILCDGYSEN